MRPTTRYLLSATAAALLSLSVDLSAVRADEKPAFGGADDTAFAERLWLELVRTRLAGPDRINTAAYKGLEPHGSINQVVATLLTLDGRTGRVIVKANHGGDAGLTLDEVYNKPSAFLGAYTVMFKREASYDPENKDWFWVKFAPGGAIDAMPDGRKLAGRVAKGMTTGCIACHTEKGGGDLEVLTDR